VEKAVLYLKSTILYFLDLLFPIKCIGCKFSGEILCKNCINKLQITNRETSDNIFAIYDYRDTIIKDAIWKLKYHHTPYIGQKLGELLYFELIEEINMLQMFSIGSPILVLPVPISQNKKKNRGYNQSEIIAKSFCNKDINNIFQFNNKIIYKKIDTIPQARLTNRNKRLQNIKNAFEIKNSIQVKGKTIIIIDDVTTTGGTLLEIIKILKKSGAKKVVGFAVAH
jgi:ComF family protein